MSAMLAQAMGGGRRMGGQCKEYDRGRKKVEKVMPTKFVILDDVLMKLIELG